MSFMVSKSLEGDVDESSLLEENSIKLKDDNCINIYLENITFIKFKKNKTIIMFICDNKTIAAIINNSIQNICFEKRMFNNLSIKEIIKKDNAYLCKILCKEKKN